LAEMEERLTDKPGAFGGGKLQAEGFFHVGQGNAAVTEVKGEEEVAGYLAETKADTAGKDKKQGAEGEKGDFYG